MSKPNLFLRAFRKIFTPMLWGRTSAQLQCMATSYSQFGEDVMCSFLFAAGHKGFFVDVGAYHPMLYSNTSAFYFNGWRGIAVDANPEVAALFGRFRPEDTFIHSAVGVGAGTVELAVFAEGTFNCTADQIDHVPERVRKTARMVSVPLRTLASILEEQKVSSVDFLNVDCEGNDLNVLKSNDWTRWCPRVICVEDHEENWGDSEIAHFLRGHGYLLKNRAVFSSIFVLDTAIQELGTRDSVPVV